MKKLIMLGILAGMLLTSLGSCFIPVYEDGGRDRGHGHGHGDEGRGDRDEHRR
jgi:hypothetical protein